MSDRTRLLVLAFAVVGALAFAGGAAVWVIGSNRDAAAAAQSLARQIQRERVRSIRENCEALNQRHDNTIARLDELIAKAPDKARAKAGRDGTVLLIEALSPKRDCEALVRKQAPGG